MNSPVALNTVTITVRDADGNVVLGVPADVPLGELMPEFLEVIGQPDAEGGVLSPRGGEAYPSQNTFAELGVDDGAILVLHEVPGAAPRSSDGASAIPAQRAPTVVPAQRVCEASSQRSDRPRATRQALATGTWRAGAPRPRAHRLTG